MVAEDKELDTAAVIVMLCVLKLVFGIRTVFRRRYQLDGALSGYESMVRAPAKDRQRSK